MNTFSCSPPRGTRLNPLPNALLWAACLRSWWQAAVVETPQWQAVPTPRAAAGCKGLETRPSGTKQSKPSAACPLISPGHPSGAVLGLAEPRSVDSGLWGLLAAKWCGQIATGFLWQSPFSAVSSLWCQPCFGRWAFKWPREMPCRLVHGGRQRWEQEAVPSCGN